MGILGKLFSMVSGGGSEQLPDQAMLIDVRSPAEFAAGHIEGAVPLPLPAMAQRIDEIAQDKEAPIIVYCQSGARSAAARQQLINLGYRQVVNGGGVFSLARRMNRRILS